MSHPGRSGRITTRPYNRAVSAIIEIPELHRYTIAEYHRLLDSDGIDQDARVELIDGLVFDMGTRSPEHEKAVDWLVDWVFAHLDRDRYWHRAGAPLTLAGSEPEPDLAIVQRPGPPASHPTEAALVVEVALSSHDRDLRLKPAVYAPYVPEYWVIDLQRRLVVVHRNPHGSTYRSVTVASDGEAITARSVELGTIPTEALFAAAFDEPAAGAGR